MRIIDVLQNDKKDSKWIIDNYRNGDLFVDNSFQRRYVWVERNQIQLMETILLGYAIPEIYLWAIDTNPNTGNTKYSIIDGQQRIGALFDFVDGKFALKASMLSNPKATYADKLFNNLTDDQKRNIWNYKFSIRQVPDTITKEEIVKMFLRLNSTDKSLNPQELRNAEFNGMFLETAQKISEFNFWEDNKIFTKNDLRRMLDIEFISSLLIFLRKGIESEITQKAINDTYDLFNNVYDESEQDIETTKMILKQLQLLIDFNENNIKFISKTTHLYTLFGLTYYVILKYNSYTSEHFELLSQFMNEYANEESKDDIVIRYRENSQDATKSKTSRMNRLKILKEYLNI